MQNRAYSLLEVRAFDEDTRKFSGVATTPTVDRVGDIIDPMGVKFTNPLPLLHQHFHDRPIGTVRFKRPTKDGIEFDAEIAKVEEPGALQDRVDTAWGEIKYGLVRATSIGFRAIEYSFMDNGGIRFSEVEVYELSTVTIPANSEALITAVKSMGDDAYLRAIKGLDAEARKVAGIPDPEIPARPDLPATGQKGRVVRLEAPARDGAAPFIVRNIIRT